jgi:DNA-binding PadR family transcriptional regulator
VSNKHAILGVLMKCPGHGYKIKKIFAPFVSKDGLNDGQVYPMLTRLEKEGLVRKEIVRQEKSPNKNMYHITEHGRAEFLRWLTGSEDETDPVKYDFFRQYSFLMKCNFLEHLPVEERIAKLKRQIEIAEEKVADYERIRDEMLERGLDDYKIRIVEFGIETQQLKIRWIADLLDRELGKRVSGRSRRSTAAKRPVSGTHGKKHAPGQKG